MGKAAKHSSKTTTTASDPIQDYSAMFDARSRLLASMVGMGWRLAAMVLVPVFIGVSLDKRFDSEPSLALAGFFIAVFGSGVLINSTFRDITREQAEEDALIAKSKKTRKQKNA